jgi:Na+/H+ antiporter NhaD/arsenite permease-like protein
MNQSIRRTILSVSLIAISLALIWVNTPSKAQSDSSPVLIGGSIFDQLGQPVKSAQITLRSEDRETVFSQVETQPTGDFFLDSPDVIPDSLFIIVERAHFKPLEYSLSTENIQSLRSGDSVIIPDLKIERQITVALWVATLVFIAVLVLIATGKLHITLASLVGASLIYLVSYLGSPLSENLFIFNFQESLSFIDWNVIFLIMGMMIVIAVIEETGIFQWLSFTAYKISGGKIFLLLPILMLITGIASAFLDNVTTMLLMTPISVQIAISLGLNPLVLLIPEVFASNVIGISTLIGTPTNILIGSYAKLSFNDFLTNLTPGVLLAFIGLIVFSFLTYRKQLSGTQELSDILLEKLEEQAQITQPDHLKKAGIVGLGMLILFMFGEHIHLVPAVTALIGATTLMVWIRPDIEEMIEAVDWTTLVFFMTLFIVVGAIQEVGLISFIANAVGRLVGENLLVAMLVVIWLSALLSTVIANIPFTAAMLPVVGYLTSTVPGAESMVLFYCLSVGSAMGGNASLISASANMVTAGIADRAGYKISYVYFFKKGAPAMLITVSLATIWLLIRFL